MHSEPGAVYFLIGECGSTGRCNWLFVFFFFFPSTSVVNCFDFFCLLFSGLLLLLCTLMAAAFFLNGLHLRDYMLYACWLDLGPFVAVFLDPGI